MSSSDGIVAHPAFAKQTISNKMVNGLFMFDSILDVFYKNRIQEPDFL
jgi:hypothetical protein